MSDFPPDEGLLKPSPLVELPAAVPPGLVELHGFGRTATTRSHLAQIDSVAGAISALRKAGDRGVVPRGLGSSYGDAAQNAGGTTLDLTKLNQILHVDADGETPTVTAQAGVSLDALMKALLPFGLWIPVLPGTRQVTVGGAIGADVHGKNHHTQGSFGTHVRSLDLLTADGIVRTLTPEGEDPDLFWATVGGMGLTGVILQATIAVQRTESAYFAVDTQRCGDLDELMATMSERDDDYTYSVAWFDAVTRGKHLGRAVLTRGNKATVADLPAKLRAEPLKFVAPSYGTVPEVFPNRVINRATVKAFSELWFRKAPKHKVGEIQNITTFFHPLDSVSGWNNVYGPNGFLQYQFVVPFSEHEAFRRCVHLIVESGHPSFLNVLKRFGPSDPAPLSFPMPGWTLTVDFPITEGLDRLCSSLDEQVVGAGGRCYLAKDSRLSPETLRQMYPRLDDFLAVRRRIDPGSMFTSDLARRLHL